MTSATRKAHLSWVRPPIQAAIGRAQVALDAYFEKRASVIKPPAGVQREWIDNQVRIAQEKLSIVVKEVESIFCALTLVQSTGGAALTEEMNTLCQSIVDRELEPEVQDRSLMALMTALVTLPNYIGMVVAGAPDSPSIVSKSINEIRSIRGVPPFVEESILPGLSFRYVDSPRKDLHTELNHRERVVEASARPFQTAFGTWIGTQSKDSLKAMQEILRELQVVTNRTEVSCYWWVADVLIDLVLQGSLRHNSHTVTQLRTVSVAISKAAGGGEEAAAEALGSERFKNLLYVISMAKTHTEESEHILNSFNISSGVDTDYLRQLQVKLDQATGASIETVSEEVSTLLAQAMVSLGRAAAAANDQVFKSQINAFQCSIRDIANIFFMINDDELASIARTACGRLNDDPQPHDLNQDVLEGLKGDLLYLDARIKNLTENPATKALGIDGVAPDVVANVVAESLKALVGVRRAIGLHVDSGEARGDLRDGLEELVRVAAVTTFTGALKVGSILKGVATSLIDLLDANALTHGEPYDNAARALVAVEIYLDSIHSGFDPDPSLLEKAVAALSANQIDLGDFKAPQHSDLIELFEAADHQNGDDDALLVELSEVRSLIEGFVNAPKFDDQALLQSVHQACDRIAMASRISQVEAISSLASAIAVLTNDIYGRARGDGFDSEGCAAAVKDAGVMLIRCMDEYGAKGAVAIFVSGQVSALKEFIFTADERTTVGEDIAPQQAPDGAVCEPEVVELEEAVEVELSSGEIILASEAADSEEERPLPEGIDPFLLNLYRKEYLDNHQSLVASVTIGASITEVICRTVHSLRGCSGSVGCLPLNRVFATLENKLRDAQANGSTLVEADCSLLSELLEDALDFHNRFPWDADTELESLWIESISALFTGTVSAPEVIPAVVEVAVQEEAIVQVAELPAEAPKEEPVAVEVEEPAIQQPRAQEPQTPALVTYDQELAQFYIEEADERLPQLEDNFRSWLEDLTNRELIHTIKRQMHTLKGAAAMAVLTPIQDVTHLMESLFESLSLNIIPADEACVQLVQIVLQEIGGQTTAVRAGRGLPTPVQLIACLQAAVDHNKVDLALLHEEEAGDPVAKATLGTQKAPQINVELSEVAQSVDQPEAAKPVKSRRRSRGKESQRRRNEARKARLEEAKAQATTVDGSDIGGEEVLLAHSEDVLPEPVVEVCAEEPVHASETHVPELPQEPVEADPQVIREVVGAPGPDLVQSPEPGAGVAEVTLSAADAESDERKPSTQRIALPRSSIYDGFDQEIYVPVESESVRQLIERALPKQAGPAIHPSAAEKIRVDQRLLESAVSQASELTSSRHRQYSLQKDVSIGIAALIDQIAALALHQGRVIQALRSYSNQPAGMQSSRSQNDQVQLERFDGLGSLAVHASQLIAQAAQDLQYLKENGEAMEESIQNQGRLISSLQRDLIDCRLVPFNNIRPALTSVIENTSKQLKKPVKIEFVGANTVLDKMILDAIKDPLFHILRNAIDHGLEAPGDRKAAGKPEDGFIQIGVFRRAKNLVISIQDDGKGIDPAAVRSKALALGIIRETDDLTDKELVRLITHNGLSTAKSVGTISGRGVGMDNVAAAVESMGGFLQIDSAVGVGTTFTLELPFNIGTNSAMICSTGGQWFAIPTYTMVQVESCERSDLEAQLHKNGVATVQFEGEHYPVVHLADLIAMPELRRPTGNPRATLLLCRQGDIRIAIDVEKADTMTDIHIRELEGILRNARGIIGETELSDGSAIFVLDVMELVRLNLKHDGRGFTVRQNRVRSVTRDAKPLALVVDDAMSYLRQLTQFFESRGFEVITARDGLQALDLLPLDRMPSIISVDLEMPNLDGFGLTSRIRAMPDYDAVPIMMLTSRTGPVVEQQAKEAGVTIFVNKPCDRPTFDKAVSTVCPGLIPEEATV